MIDLREVSKLTWAIIGGIIVLGTVIGGAIGALTYLKTEFAPLALADDVRLQGIRLEQKIIQDNIERAMSQMRQIQISCGTSDPLKMNPDAQRHYHELQMILQKNQQRLQRLNYGGKP